MSIASPTLRSSSSTDPGPSLSRSPISMRARPSTAETWTGTSNTASRSAAIRVVGPSGSATTVTSACAPASSRLGSGILPFSLIVGSPQRLVCVGRIAARARVTGDRHPDRRIRSGAVAVDAAVGPFDAAIAGRDVRLREHHQPALKVLGAHDVLEFFACLRVERIVDAYGDMRRRHELAKAAARQFSDLGKRLA